MASLPPALGSSFARLARATFSSLPLVPMRLCSHIICPYQELLALQPVLLTAVDHLQTTSDNALAPVAILAILAITLNFHLPTSECRIVSSLVAFGLTSQTGIGAPLIAAAAWVRPSFPGSPPRQRPRTNNRVWIGTPNHPARDPLQDMSPPRGMEVDSGTPDNVSDIGQGVSDLNIHLTPMDQEIPSGPLPNAAASSSGAVLSGFVPGGSLSITSHLNSQAASSNVLHNTIDINAQVAQPPSISPSHPTPSPSTSTPNSTPPLASATSSASADPQVPPPPPPPPIPAGTESTNTRPSRNDRRWRCPVVGCPQHSPNADGYPDLASLRRSHVDYHAVGTYSGSIPADWLHFHRLTYCGFCSRTLHSRYNGFCPSCRPLARAAGAAPQAREPVAPPEAAATQPQAARQPALPSLEAVHTKHVPVLKYIPKQLRPLWAQCLSRGIASCSFHNDIRRWTEQQMLAKCVLCTPPRAGKQHQNQRLAFTRHRLQRWLDGERASLWQDIPSYRSSKQSRTQPPQVETALRHKRCEDFCREGADSKACKALHAPAPSDPNVVFDEMVRKHPAASRHPDLARLGASNVGLAPAVDALAITAALKSFNKHSGAGPSGLRPFHLRQALVPAHSDQVVDHLASLVNLLVRGEAHNDVSPWLCGALLMALPKKDGTSRPIAVGEVFRRLAAKVLCQAYQDQARNYLWPLQIGVAHPLGTEVGLQVARQWCFRHRRSPNMVFVKLDFANAFNTIDRELFLKEVRSIMPGLAPWVDYCYARPSKLVLGGNTLSSESGVQQGDPLGPLLFSLALQPVLQELAATRAAGGLELVYSYLDDLCLAGDALAVVSALNTLKARCADVGLTLSTGLMDEAGNVISKDKCELILTGGAASAVDVTHFPSDFKVVRDGNFELLGGPVGSPEFCNAHTQARVTKALGVLTALGEVPDPQVALKLLRSCAGFSKMVYSMRVVPASFHADALQTFDAKVRACFEQFTCLHPDDEQWAQANLSTDSGGLGLRSLAQHSSAAFLASRSSCVELCQQLDPSHTFQSTDGLEPAPERLAFDAYNSSVNDDDRLPLNVSVALSQKDLSAAIGKRFYALSQSFREKVDFD